MKIKIGCKRWSSGAQIGLRIYHDSVLALEEILDKESRDKCWSSLTQFLNSSKRKPYSRKLMILDSNRRNPIEATTTIARHGDVSTQGYITAPKNSWLYTFIYKNINRDYKFDYTSTKDYDLLVVPYPSKNIISIKSKEEKGMKRVVQSFCRKNHFSPPQNAKEIGLYFELKELGLLVKNGYIPDHRYPSIKTKKAELIGRNVSCDIDVFERNKKFNKFVEVKSVSGPPDTEFILTVNEYNSREKCRKKGWNYEIIVYYHHGNKILKRKVIHNYQDIKAEPINYRIFF
jgi:hypothetical protein